MAGYTQLPFLQFFTAVYTLAECSH